jgi:hypothetical protein
LMSHAPKHVTSISGGSKITCRLLWRSWPNAIVPLIPVWLEFPSNSLFIYHTVQRGCLHLLISWAFAELLANINCFNSVWLVNNRQWLTHQWPTYHLIFNRCQRD